MPDKQPRAGEDALLLLGVDLVVDEDLAADLPGREIDEAGTVTGVRSVVMPASALLSLRA